MLVFNFFAQGDIQEYDEQPQVPPPQDFAGSTPAIGAYCDKLCLLLEHKPAKLPTVQRAAITFLCTRKAIKQK